MEYKVLINDFEGPLDLLLHLIKESNIDIKDIKIEDITKQYLDYINAMEEMDLNIASEYLVMAAELIEMKSRILLPNEQLDGDEYEEDPKEELINRLLEYKKYKDVTPEFKELEQERKELFTKDPSYIDSKLDLGDVTIEDLANALTKFLERKNEEKPLNTKITAKEYSVEKRSDEIRKILISKAKIEFTSLFDHYEKDYVIITFLSVLEMAKKHELVITQDNNFGIIYLANKGDK